jgi:hypothetical protein
LDLHSCLAAVVLIVSAASQTACGDGAMATEDDAESLRRHRDAGTQDAALGDAGGSGDASADGDADAAVDGTGGSDGSDGSAGTAARLGPSDLTYLGAFRVPQGASGIDPNGFSYGGGFAAGNVYYDPTRSGAPTIFLSGYLSAGYVSSTPSLAQISIPALADPLVVGLGGLKTATLLQPFADPSGRHDPLNGSGFCGYAAYAGSLLGFCAVAYDASGSQSAAAFVNGSLALASPSAAGPYAVGSLHQTMYGGYATLVPPEWQSFLGAKVVAGNGPWSIISVNSAGPGLHTIDADALVGKPSAGANIASSPLAYYPIGNQQLGAWNSNLPNQTINGTPVPTVTVTDPAQRSGLPVGNGGGPTWTIPYNDSSMRIEGVLFADRTRSVLFFGKKGLGPYCYGLGTADATLAGHTDSSGVEYCYDPDGAGGKGDHAYPYSYFVWAYDVNDYLTAKQGAKAPWMVFPYTGWTLALPGGGSMGGGVAWDPLTRCLYVAALCTDPGGSSFTGAGYFCGPVIHVFQIAG